MSTPTPKQLEPQHGRCLPSRLLNIFPMWRFPAGPICTRQTRSTTAGSPPKPSPLLPRSSPPKPKPKRSEKQRNHSKG